MKIEMTNGRVTATAETLSDIQKLVALGKVKEAKEVESIFHKKRMFKAKKCGYCRVVYKSLGNHQRACPQRKTALAKNQVAPEIKTA
jgi:hypothetical protein